MKPPDITRGQVPPMKIQKFFQNRKELKMECSLCGKPLEFIGQFGGAFSPEASVSGIGSGDDFNMWRAQVCTKCKLIFCEDCLELGRPTPCPDCGQPTEPAFRGIVNAMGKIKKPVETEIFYGKTEIEALKKAEERNIPKERIMILKVTREVESWVSTGEGVTRNDALMDALRLEHGAFDISEPEIIYKGFMGMTKWKIEVEYKLPARVMLRYRTR